ncbi:MAG TPA: CpsB/CapC family capsule biosynthesis tyrosine phosphatase, partial [Gemmataceae bacterium]|nr:CpsB/CapC family capsule biosynthesis tyrosine phosphatase [Gemmataceae bacterium]
ASRRACPGGDNPAARQDPLMLPLVDLHCHLLAGLDDGPRTPDDALEMCRIAYAEGTRLVAALAHQNERWSAVTPDVIRAAVAGLKASLEAAGVALTAFPTAEVTAHPELEALWDQGRLLSVADRGAHLLVEMPHGLFVDLRPTARALGRRGVRIILAHPERHPELLHDPGAIEGLIREGCLVQVSSASVTEPASAADARALRGWFRRGCAHLIGSDGHSPRKRRPLLADAYRQVRAWAGAAVADRVCGANGVAVLNGRTPWLPEPEPPRRWLPRFW